MITKGDKVTIKLERAQHFILRPDGSKLWLDSAGELIDVTVLSSWKPNPLQTLYLGVDYRNRTYTFMERDIWSSS